VTKNTLMGIAIDGQDNWRPMTELLKGSSAFFGQDDFSGAIKLTKTSRKLRRQNFVAVSWKVVS